jgi:hypothetical protein
MAGTIVSTSDMPVASVVTEPFAAMDEANRILKTR